ncbi:hypothetical protein NLU13_6336 [Sarocladium strictum]|uniref:Uncharacterized protein n=1 Tax=Sarocladium strictum TaxID=5046 RepID=A0AA39GGB0_SARSR|nr:hypothetical protein NLU13_6336 [Sarocladium strictum]
MRTKRARTVLNPEGAPTASLFPGRYKASVPNAHCTQALYTEPCLAAGNTTAAPLPPKPPTASVQRPPIKLVSPVQAVTGRAGRRLVPAPNIMPETQSTVQGRPVLSSRSPARAPSRDRGRHGRDHDRDDREGISLNPRKRRAQSPLPRRPSFPRPTTDAEPAGIVNGGAEAPSPPVTRRNSVQGHALQLPIVPSKQPYDVTAASDESIAAGFEKFAKCMSDVAHWFSQRYINSKRVQRLKETLPRHSGGASEYGSQFELHKAQIRDGKTQTELAGDRYSRAIAQAQEAFLSLLAQLESKGILPSGVPSQGVVPNGLDVIKQATLENRIASLENSYRTEIEAQGRRIAFLENKVDVASANDDHQAKKIEELEKLVTKLAKQVQGADSRIEQLIDDASKAKSAASQLAPHAANAAQIADLQALSKDFTRKLRGVEVETDRLAKQVKEMATVKPQPPNHQKAFASKEDLKAFAKTADLGNFVSQNDVKAFALQKDLKLLATKDEIKAFATKEDVKACATSRDIDMLASRTTKEIDSLTSACETKSQTIAKSVEDLRSSLEEASEDMKRFQASVNDLAVAKELIESHNMPSRILALESNTAKKEDLAGINVEHLQTVIKKELAADIELQINNRVAALPRAQSAAVDTPPAASLIADKESVILEARRRLKEDLSVISKTFAPIIDRERQEREKLSTRISDIVADYTALAARVTSVETKPPPASMAELDKIRSDYVALIGQVSSSVHQLQTSLTERANGLTNEMQRIISNVHNLYGQMNGFQHHMTEQYNQVLHQQQNLQGWQQNFSTKTLYRDMVVKMQELVPNGTLARLQNAEVRLENVERDVRLHRPQRMSGTPQMNNTAQMNNTQQMDGARGN